MLFSKVAFASLCVSTYVRAAVSNITSLNGESDLKTRDEPLRGHWYDDIDCSQAKSHELRTSNNPIILSDLFDDIVRGVRMTSNYAIFTSDDCDENEGDAPKDACSFYKSGARIVCLSQTN